MAEQIIAAFQTKKPFKISGMSWQEYIAMLEELKDFRLMGETQSGRGQ